MDTTFLLPQPATPDDQPTIVDLIEEAATWLHSKGIDQWARPWPSRAERDERIRAGIAAGVTWMVWDGSVAVATVTVRPDGDPRLWRPDELRQPAVYAHRLVVNRNYAGLGIGARLLDWAGRRGAATMRIDVWTTNEALHRYYQRLGFNFLRTADDGADGGSDCPSLALFERPIAATARRAATNAASARRTATPIAVSARSAADA